MPTQSTKKSQSEANLAPDPWSVWFFRLVQVTGLASFIYELLFEKADRPYILLVGLAMMLGGAGIQLIVVWALKRLTAP